MENKFKRIFFLQSHELEAEGAKLLHRAGFYYHVAVEYVEDLIAKGIAAVVDPAEAAAKDVEEMKAEGETAAAEVEAIAAGTLSNAAASEIEHES